MQKDLGCIEFIQVHDLNATTWENGIMFIDGPELAFGGCFSAYGRRPGDTGGNGDIRKLGAKSGWQIIALDNCRNCNCHSTRVVQHETMHALGFSHEHQRPDRDKFITFNANNVASPVAHNRRQFEKLTEDVWVDLGKWAPFELGSVMMYGSSTRAISGTNTLTLKVLSLEISHYK